MPSPSTHLILVVDDHLWPALDALAQWRDGLSRVTVVTSHGNEVEQGPASRLEALLQLHLPRVRFHRAEPVNDDSPTDVAAAIKGAFTGDDVTVVASDVPALMLLGAARFADAHPGTPVFFREGDGDWYRLTDGDPVNLGRLDRAALDVFPALDLVRASWADSERSVLAEPARPPRHLVTAARQCMAGATWERAFRAGQNAAPRYRSIPDGFAFELFVMALLGELGVAPDDLILGAKLFHQRTLQEVDVIAHVDGRLHLIDCKIGAEARVPVGTQIREAFATQEHLGDDSGRVMLLRPRMQVPDTMQSLAHEYGVDVVDRRALENRSLPDILRRFVGLASVDS